MPTVGYGTGGGTERGVDHGQALAGHGGAARVSAVGGVRGRGGDARGAVREG